MRFLLIIVGIATGCNIPPNYDELIEARIEEIEQEEDYWNTVVLCKEDIGYCSDYPYWSDTESYYEGDRVKDSLGNMFWAMKDSKGIKPSLTSPEWKKEEVSHPYYFLRDSASLRALKTLLKNENTFVRLYSFGALDFRNADGLDEILMENLQDTATFFQLTGHVGSYVCPADLMIRYRMNEMTRERKEELLLRIRGRFPHLKYAERLLADELQ